MNLTIVVIFGIPLIPRFVREASNSQAFIVSSTGILLRLVSWGTIPEDGEDLGC